MKFTVCILYSVCVGGFYAANIKQIFKDDRDETGRQSKSFGLHSSLDGQSYMWANTSAVTTAGFFGNAAVLLAGVYLLSHTDQLVDMADGLNRLLPTNGADKNQNGISGSSGNGEVANMIEKGQEMIGETLHKINNNMKNLREKVKKEFPKLADLNTPIKNLKDKLFPQTTKQKPESELVAIIEQPQVFGFDNSGVFNEDFFAEHKFDFGERNEKDEKPMVLIFPDSGSDNDDNDDDGLPFLTIGNGNVVLDNDDEDYDMELRIENIDLEDEEKLEKLEKKKKWAENFLKNYYKMQELKLKEQEKKKIMKKTIKEATKKKFQTLKTDDMKPFVHLRQDDIVIDEDTENIDEQTEESVIESKVLMNEAEYREIKQESVDNEKNKGFQYDDEFRIDDEELQSLIDSQLNNFESFKIQRQEKDEETDLEKLRKKAFEVYENQMEKAVDTDIEDFEVTTMTNFEDEDPEGKIKTSTGNDNILLGKNNKRRREQMK